MDLSNFTEEELKNLLTTDLIKNELNRRNNIKIEVGHCYLLFNDIVKVQDVDFHEIVEYSYYSQNTRKTSSIGSYTGFMDIHEFKSKITKSVPSYCYDMLAEISRANTEHHSAIEETYHVFNLLKERILKETK